MNKNSDKLDIQEHTSDVLIIGGGPAGSTVATLLAKKGYKVTLLEKDKHPRFHIGESLLPANLPLFERLGVLEQIHKIGTIKPGGEFVSPYHKHTQIFHFAEAWDKSQPYAYQVKREEFDEILIRNAQKKGALVHEECQVTSVDFKEDNTVSVEAQKDGQAGKWHAKFLIDASGRDTFLADHFKIKHRNPKHSSLAFYGHFTNVKRLEGKAEGNISLFWFEHGWFWFIPLQNGVTSVGMVTWPYHMKTKAQRSIKEFMLDNINTCKALQARLENATLINEIVATGNYSYISERNHGSNYLMLGDAYAFIDPVFSSGVLLAMQSGFIASDTIDECLSNPKSAPSVLKKFDKSMKHGPKVFSWFIYRITNSIMREFFMYPGNPLRAQEAVLSVLAGDIFGKTPIWRSVFCFKVFYYLANIKNPFNAFSVWRRRRFNIRVED